MPNLSRAICDNNCSEDRNSLTDTTFQAMTVTDNGPIGNLNNPVVFLHTEELKPRL